MKMDKIEELAEKIIDCLLVTGIGKGTRIQIMRQNQNLSETNMGSYCKDVAVDTIIQVLQRELGSGVPGKVVVMDREIREFMERFFFTGRPNVLKEFIESLPATVRAPRLKCDDNYGYTPFGWSYEVCELWDKEKTGYWITYSEGNDLNPFGDKHPTEEKAREACQVDYDRRFIKAFSQGKDRAVKC